MPNGNISWKSAMARNNTNKSSLCDAINPEYEKIVFESIRQQNFMKFIGAELLRILPGFCTLQMKYREKMAHDPSCFHPGVIGALADCAGEFAALSLLPPHSSLATTEYKLNLLARAEGDVLVANAKVVKSGKTMIVCTSEIYVRKDRSQNLCAVALMTFIPG